MPLLRTSLDLDTRPFELAPTAARLPAPAHPGADLRELRLHHRTVQTLRRAGIVTLDQLLARTAHDLRACRLGPGSIDTIVIALAARGLVLAQGTAREREFQDLGLSARAYNGLRRAGITSLQDLLTYTAADLRDIRSFGTSCLREVTDALAARGLALAP